MTANREEIMRPFYGADWTSLTNQELLFLGETSTHAEAVIRGEQPEEVALPLDGALRGDIPHSETERSEV